MDNPAIGSLKSDYSQEISIRGQSIPHGGAAIPFTPRTKTPDPPYPTAPGIPGK
jgi:hypothetical protein